MTGKQENVSDFDVVIIGGGPAGMAAAIWCADLGLNYSLLESGPKLGGQLHWIYAEIPNYPGIAVKNGAELSERFESTVGGSSAVSLNSEVASIDPQEMKTTLTSGRALRSNAIILATGVRRRRLGIPGEIEFAGRGILDSGARVKNEMAGKHIVIVGGGDAALENALILSETAHQVTLIHRRDSFSARDHFVEKALKLGNVKILLSSNLTSINGDSEISSVSIRSADSERDVEIVADNVLIRVGVEPNSELLVSVADSDAGGYILVDRRCMTSIQNIYAIGDVSDPTAPTIAGAVGDAATAAKSIRSYLKM